MNKLKIFGIVIIALLCLSLVVAKDEEILKWFQGEKPSEAITVESKDNLIQKNLYLWKSNANWKDGNCYYFDLYIGYEHEILNDNNQTELFTNYTWSDTRRELTCTQSTLTASQVEKMQLENIAWTLQELGKSNPVEVPLVKTETIIGENIKDEKVIDNGVEVIEVK